MILKGDCIEVMKAMKPNSVDAIVCDPPYGLEFMGKEWDKLAPPKTSATRGKKLNNPDPGPWGRRERISFFGDNGHRNEKCKICGKWRISSNRCSCASPEWEYRPRQLASEYSIAMQLWHTQWLTEAYRVLKPGGSMLVMGGTRTFHRLACAIEDSGFIIKDTLMWIYGSGFPKAQDLGKMIDKRGGQSLKRFGGLLKEARLRKGLSQKDVARHFPSKTGGITGCVWNWEEGTNAPTVEEVNKLIEILDLKEDKAFEAEREKIGIGTSGKTAIWNESGEMGDFDITAPLTPLAKYWDGFKVGGIKPAYEPIIWAVKPPEGSYVDNVLKWGVGVVNVDECRIGIDTINVHHFEGEHRFDKGRGIKPYTNHKGRFPANVILSHHPECVQVGVKRMKGKSSDYNWEKSNNDNPSHITKNIKSGVHYGDETVESWDCHPDCAVRLLDEQSGQLQSGDNPKRRGSAVFKNCYGEFQGQENCMNHYSRGANSGGASRFFYCAKASRAERNAGLEGMEEKELGHNRYDKCAKCGGYIFQNPDRKSACHCERPKRENNKIKGNSHPTVKPIKLFEWLIKLVTREGQTVLDPFIGSGTTIIAAHNTGRKCVGIEKEDEYLEIAKRRIDYWKNQPKQMALGA